MRRCSRPSRVRCTVDPPYFQAADETGGDGDWCGHASKKVAQQHQADGQMDALNTCRSGSTMSRRTRRVNIEAQPDLFAAEPHLASTVPSAKAVATGAGENASLRPEPERANYREAAGAAGELRNRSATPAPMRASHLLDVRAAAAWLGLSKSTLDKMRCYGVGPRFIRATGRAVRYDPADLAAFADRRRQLRTTDELPA